MQCEYRVVEVLESSWKAQCNNVKGTRDYVTTVEAEKAECFKKYE